VSLHLLTLNHFRTSYLSIWELVDHFFPPVGMLVKEGGEDYTDFNYWRDRPLDIDQFSASESEDEVEEHEEASEEDEEYDEEEEYDEDMESSFISRSSFEHSDVEGEADQRELVSGLDPVEEEEEDGEEPVLKDAELYDEPEEEIAPTEEHHEETKVKEKAQDEEDILITETLPIDALNLEAEEEVVCLKSQLTPFFLQLV
jgi:phosphatidate phosphatase LPIN